MTDIRLLLPLLAAVLGGWASVTLEDVPDYLVAGQPVTLNYTVRQHGEEPMPGLNGSIEATSGSLSATAKVTATKPGRYTATLTLPQPGEWTISINSGFGRQRVTLLPIRAIAAGAQAPVLSDADRGQRLFVGKGCVTCHTHRSVKTEGGNAGPDLSERHFAADYLAGFLADPPKALRARGSTKFMPNLELKAREIAALVAFINQEGSTAGR